MSQADFLFELGTEELPPKALKTLRDALTQQVVDRLHKHGLEHGTVLSYAAPRRLALVIESLATEQPTQSIKKRGPAVQAAFDKDGNPSKAAEGFARSCGVAFDALSRMKTDKGEWLYFESTEPGKPAAELLPQIFEESLAALPIPKRMRWGNRSAEFVRPVHWLVMMLGHDVVPCELLDNQAGNTSRGHRFHHPQTIELHAPKDYATVLKEVGYVLADFDARRDYIKHQAEQAASAIGGVAQIDVDLLDEVTALNEWPSVVVGGFDQKFLDVPAEALISSMQEHQKYFPIVDAQGKLLPHFITFANIESTDVAQVKSGNERVIRPRLSDAEFFWLQDKKQRLDTKQKGLESVVFQQQLGSLWEKSLRVARIAAQVANTISANAEHAERAGQLCKCDLNSEMVGEFPELQGIMGRYYAQHDGEADEVAFALEEYYWPKFSGDQTPQRGVSQALAIAERVDTLCGIFAIGQLPTGDKDPFGLRRAALGLIRIIVENQLDIDLKSLLEVSFDQQPVSADAELKQKLWTYLSERMKGYYLDQHIRHDVFDAVSAVSSGNLIDTNQRLVAVNAFCENTNAGSLAAGNKRISNILKKQNADTQTAAINESLLSEAQEIALAKRIQQVESELAPALTSRDYPTCLNVLANLRNEIDAFFEHVMVMAEDEAVKRNRIALLQHTAALFKQVADISMLQLD